MTPRNLLVQVCPVPSFLHCVVFLGPLFYHHLTRGDHFRGAVAEVGIEGGGASNWGGSTPIWPDQFSEVMEEIKSIVNAEGAAD